MVTANEKFCCNNRQLVDDVYNNFEQISLTRFNSNKTPKSGGEVDLAKVSKIESYRRKIRGQGIDPALDERNYNLPTSLYRGSSFEKIVTSFKSKAIRVRLTKLKGGSEITPHIDYDPSYAVRVVIPLITNPSTINRFWVRGKLEEYHLPADGSAYFLNVGFKHAVANGGKDSRFCLMFSLENQEDLSLI